jgi:hypothetical protein
LSRQATDAERRDAAAEAAVALRNRPQADVVEKTPTQYEKYTMPGGKNYRELLLKLPTEYTGKGVAPKDLKNVFQSSHFHGEPNVLAHVRFNDRVDASGKKTLFLEEIQSDWHQKGKKQGYYSPPKAFEFDPSTFGQDEHQYFVHSNGKKFAVGKGTVNDEADAKAYLQRYVASENKQNALQAENYVPDAPFKTTWPDLALKRMVKWAVDHGYDQVASLYTGMDLKKSY